MKFAPAYTPQEENCCSDTINHVEYMVLLEFKVKKGRNPHARCAHPKFIQSTKRLGVRKFFGTPHLTNNPSLQFLPNTFDDVRSLLTPQDSSHSPTPGGDPSIVSKDLADGQGRDSDMNSTAPFTSPPIPLSPSLPSDAKASPGQQLHDSDSRTKGDGDQQGDSERQNPPAAETNLPSDSEAWGEITVALNDLTNGDSDAVRRLLPLVYFELRQVARNKLRNERVDHTLQATALVHEVIVKILGRTTQCTWENRRQFFQSAATVMRQVLIDSARAKKRAKRAGTVQLSDDEVVVSNFVDIDLILDLDSSLALLEKEDAQAAELVKLRLYAGLSVAEASEVIGISRSKGYEDWMFARYWFSKRSPKGLQPE